MRPTAPGRGRPSSRSGAPATRSPDARRFLSLLVFLLATGCATALPPRNQDRPFEFAQDTFGFANDTVWRHDPDPGDTTPPPAPAKNGERYRRRCFIMAAGVVQFWRFARFDPDAEPVPLDELALRVRQVRDTAAWHATLPEESRIMFPGYASFTDLSRRAGQVVRANLGPGWTTYFHVRKFVMPFVPSPGEQEKTHQLIRHYLDCQQPLVLWLYNFPHVSINHAVTVFAEAPAPAPGQFAWLVYDPNSIDGPRQLVYDRAQRKFSYGRTFYFAGGPVHVRPMYRGLLN